MASEIQVLQGMDTLAYVRLLENEKTERGQLIPYQTSLSFEPQRDTDTTKTKSGTVSTTSALETDLEVEFVNNISVNIARISNVFVIIYGKHLIARFYNTNMLWN